MSDVYQDFLEWLAAERGEYFDQYEGEGNLPDRDDDQPDTSTNQPSEKCNGNF